MGSYARIPFGQNEALTRAALETIELSHDHAGFPLIEKIKQVVPFRYIAISGLDFEGLGAGTGNLLLSDFPAAFIAEYFAGDYIAHDPLAALFRSGPAICRDSEAFATAEARRDGIEVLDLLRRHGIQERTSIRVEYGGKTRCSVSVISDKPLDDGACMLLQHFALSLHREVSRPVIEALNSELKLTRGELYCLQHAARGLTSEDIAREQTYSLETINTYLKSATRKLGAQNRTQAVAEALRRQLIG